MITYTCKYCGKKETGNFSKLRKRCFDCKEKNKRNRYYRTKTVDKLLAS